MAYTPVLAKIIFVKYVTQVAQEQQMDGSIQHLCKSPLIHFRATDAIDYSVPNSSEMIHFSH